MLTLACLTANKSQGLGSVDFRGMFFTVILIVFYLFKFLILSIKFYMILGNKNKFNVLEIIFLDIFFK